MVKKYTAPAALIEKFAESLWDYSDEEGAYEAEKAAHVAEIAAWLKELKPQDEVETMIMLQMFVSNNTIAACNRRANASCSMDGHNMVINQICKLTRSFNDLVETLNRHRGKGSIEQRIIVQHVYVGNGGKAIVGGSVTPGREGGRQETEKQPRKKQIEHAPAITMPGAHAQRPLPVARDDER